MHAPQALPLVQDLADALARDAQQLRQLFLRQVEVALPSNSSGSTPGGM